MNATYSPEDNKLRLYADGRLEPELYARVKGHGFRWAPKQALFVAPAWTPAREDLLIDLCGEIGDEDTSLADRAEERSDRFEGYQENRAKDAASAEKAVSAIADGIPFGQPILVGHHSERHARRDAKRIENGMRRAVRMWDTSQYWKARAAGALRNASYKERPDVRARRIKKLEAEERKQKKAGDQARAWLLRWEHPDKLKRKDGQKATPQQWALFLANHDSGFNLWYDLDRGNITPEEAQARAIKGHRAVIAWADRWAGHLAHRLEYERTMLEGQGGTVADRTGPEKGGAVACWAAPRGGWAYVVKVNKVTVSILDNWGNGGGNFKRTIPFDKLSGIMSAAKVEEARDAGRIVGDEVGFFLREPPKPEPLDDEEKRTRELQAEGMPRGDAQGVVEAEHMKAHAVNHDRNCRGIDAMRESLREGVKTVSAPQLFPTPVSLARRMAEAAGIQPGHRVLEPSAGTGRLIDAIRKVQHPGHLIAVEHSATLAEGLKTKYQPGDATIVCADFLECDGGRQWLGPFDRVVMNPPFKDGTDIRHIQHARAMLAEGGRLVALCAGGPRQEAALRPEASTWEVLPAGTFAEAGTGVGVVLLTMPPLTPPLAQELRGGMIPSDYAYGKAVDLAHKAGRGAA